MKFVFKVLLFCMLYPLLIIMVPFLAVGMLWKEVNGLLDNDHPKENPSVHGDD